VDTAEVVSCFRLPSGKKQFWTVKLKWKVGLEYRMPILVHSKEAWCAFRVHRLNVDAMCQRAKRSKKEEKKEEKEEEEKEVEEEKEEPVKKKKKKKEDEVKEEKKKEDKKNMSPSKSPKKVVIVENEDEEELKILDNAPSDWNRILKDKEKLQKDQSRILTQLGTAREVKAKLEGEQKTWTVEKKALEVEIKALKDSVAHLQQQLSEMNTLKEANTKLKSELDTLKTELTHTKGMLSVYEKINNKP